ncbi:hypothetical protein Acsp02_85410 [Actinoplanes sp. NBRC 103695]|nr:hypothetical protein Acsp02_85410 [Actinoplanes sp. NBRC 103695]
MPSEFAADGAAERTVRTNDEGDRVIHAVLQSLHAGTGTYGVRLASAARTGHTRRSYEDFTSGLPNCPRRPHGRTTRRPSLRRFVTEDLAIGAVQVATLRAYHPICQVSIAPAEAHEPRVCVV